MKKIILSVFMILAVSAATFGATQALFSDEETSTGNTFTASTLDLNVDGDNVNVVKFNRTVTPLNQPTGTYILKNVGSVNGFLDLENVVVVSNDNGCIDPETEAGDITCGIGEGELAQQLGFTLYVDVDKDGYYSVGDVYIFNGYLNNLSNVDANYPINAGQEINVRAVVNYWSNSANNLAQGDDVEFSFSFELGQQATQ